MPTPPSPLKLILSTLSFLLWPALILFLAGDWRWPEGWIFGGWFLAMCVSIIAWLYRHDPALLAERYRRPGTGGQSRRDTLIVYLMMLGFIAWMVLMPLDAGLGSSPDRGLGKNSRVHTGWQRGRLLLSCHSRCFPTCGRCS